VHAHRTWFADLTIRPTQDILVEAAKGAVILAILERLLMTRPQYFLEDHIDYLGIQALLFKRTSMGFVAQLRVYFAHTRRIAD
jgi:hypothetical protein